MKFGTARKSLYPWQCKIIFLILLHDIVCEIVILISVLAFSREKPVEHLQ